MIRKPVFILFCSLISALACAQSIDTAKLNTYFSTLEQHHKFMGSVAVSQKGQLIYTRSVARQTHLKIERDAIILKRYGQI